MMAFPKHDPQKVYILCHYLQKAAHNLKERQAAREKLAASLERLRKISAKSVQRYVDELEQRIALALAREQQVSHAQTSEEAMHKHLAIKIDRLDTKLDNYLRTRAAREKRIKQLETKIRHTFSDRHNSLTELKTLVSNAERLHKIALRDNPTNPSLKSITKRLRSIQKKIKTLK